MTPILYQRSIYRFTLLLALFACGDGGGTKSNTSPATDALVCGAHQTECGNECASLARDPAHCGGCGRACEAGLVCASGSCVLRCPAMLESCDASCVDLSKDSEHCGSCDKSCAAGQLCTQGSCTDTCPVGQTLCGDQCVKLASDESHCGACEVACVGGESCMTGKCQRNEWNGCKSTDLSEALGTRVQGDTTSLADTYSPSCGQAGRAEAVYRFTAPASGKYHFSTLGSTIDTVIALRKESCAGEEIACSDDGVNGSEVAEAFAKLKAGETLIVSIEGFASEGPFALGVSGVSEGELDACCGSHPQAGCGNREVESCVCAADSFCCSAAWDESCAALAEAECSLDCKVDRGPCDAEDIGSTVPQDKSGSTVLRANALAPSCSQDGSPDMAYVFTAPEAGDYTFDTDGSDFDSVLYLLTGSCEGAIATCDDAYRTGLGEKVFAKLAQGESVVIVIDGYGGEGGAYKLHVDRNASNGAAGDCCTPHEEPTCSVETIRACVCAQDDTCCESGGDWDQLCVDGVEAFACGTCQ